MAYMDSYLDLWEKTGANPYEIYEALINYTRHNHDLSSEEVTLKDLSWVTNDIYLVIRRNRMYKARYEQSVLLDPAVA